MDKYLVKRQEIITIDDALPAIVEDEELFEKDVVYIEDSDEEWIESQIPTSDAAAASSAPTCGKTWGFCVTASKEVEERLKKVRCSRLQAYRQWAGTHHVIKGFVTFKLTLTKLQVYKMFNDLTANVWVSKSVEFDKIMVGELIMYMDKRSRKYEEKKEST